jgi:hypothetical protein
MMVLLLKLPKQTGHLIKFRYAFSFVMSRIGLSHHLMHAKLPNIMSNIYSSFQTPFTYRYAHIPSHFQDLKMCKDKPNGCEQTRDEISYTEGQNMEVAHYDYLII